MGRMIFVNLPVANLGKGRAFLEALGATIEPKLSDDTAACMTLSDTIHVMILSHDKFSQFTPRPISDAKLGSEVLLCLSADSREQVDLFVERGVAAGGTADPAPKQDYGVMYGRSVADPDGHIWEIMWMDAAAAQKGASAINAAEPQSA